MGTKIEAYHENEAVVEIMQNIAPNVAGFIARKQVTKEDYQNIIVPEVKRVAQNSPELNFIMVLETDLKNITIGAWTQDAILGLKHLTKWNHIAIVADSEVVEKATKIMDKVIPGEYRAFHLNQCEQAIRWVSETPQTSVGI